MLLLGGVLRAGLLGTCVYLLRSCQPVGQPVAIPLPISASDVYLANTCIFFHFIISPPGGCELGLHSLLATMLHNLSHVQPLPLDLQTFLKCPICIQHECVPSL